MLAHLISIKIDFSDKCLYSSTQAVTSSTLGSNVHHLILINIVSCRVLLSTSHACLPLLFRQRHFQTKRVFFIKDLVFYLTWYFKLRPSCYRHYWCSVEFCITQHLNVYLNRWSSYLYFASRESILECEKIA